MDRSPKQPEDTSTASTIPLTGSERTNVSRQEFDVDWLIKLWCEHYEKEHHVSIKRYSSDGEKLKLSGRAAARIRQGGGGAIHVNVTDTRLSAPQIIEGERQQYVCRQAKVINQTAEAATLELGDTRIEANELTARLSSSVKVSAKTQAGLGVGLPLVAEGSAKMAVTGELRLEGTFSVKQTNTQQVTINLSHTASPGALTTMEYVVEEAPIEWDIERQVVLSGGFFVKFKQKVDDPMQRLDGKHYKWGISLAQLWHDLSNIEEPQQSDELKEALGFFKLDETRGKIHFTQTGQLRCVQCLGATMRLAQSDTEDSPSSSHSSSMSVKGYETDNSVFEAPYIIPNYVQRMEVEKDLSKAIKQMKPRSIATKVLMLTGMGGAGKTQLLLNYLEQPEQKHYPILFIPCYAKTIGQRDSEFIGQSYSEFIDRMRAFLFPAKMDDAASPQQLAREKVAKTHSVSDLQKAFKRWQRTYPKHLLILDDLEDWNFLYEWIDPKGQGLVLVSTREPHLGGSEIQRFSVESLEKNEALDLLGKCSGIAINEKNREIANNIVSSLGHLVLAVRHAGQAIYTENINYEQFWLEFQDDPMDWLEAASLSVNDPHLPVWKMMKHDMDRLDPDAKKLWTYFVYFSQAPIPRELLYDINRGLLLRGLPPLLRLGLLQPMGFGSYHIHPLIQDISYHLITQSAGFNKNNFRKPLMQALTKSLRDWKAPKGRRKMAIAVLPHAKKVAAHFADLPEDTEVLVTQIIFTCWWWDVAGWTDGSKASMPEHFNKVVSVLINLLSTYQQRQNNLNKLQRINLLACCTMVADIYTLNKSYETARQILKLSDAIAELLYQHKEVPRGIAGLQKKENYEYYRKSNLEVEPERFFGDKEGERLARDDLLKRKANLYLLGVRGSWGKWYFYQGKLDDAKKMFEEWCNRLDGQDDLTRYQKGMALYFLGRVALEQQQLNLAKDYFRNSVEIKRSPSFSASFSASFTSILSYDFLANICQSKGEFVEAAEYFEIILSMQEASSSSLNPHNIKYLYQLSQFYFAQQNFTQAEKRFKDTLSLFKTAISNYSGINLLSSIGAYDFRMRDDNTIVKKTMLAIEGVMQCNLANLYLAQRDFHQASQHFEEAIKLLPPEEVGHAKRGLFVANQLKESENKYSEVQSKQPENDIAESSSGHINLNFETYCEALKNLHETYAVIDNTWLCKQLLPDSNEKRKEKKSELNQSSTLFPTSNSIEEKREEETSKINRYRTHPLTPLLSDSDSDSESEEVNLTPSYRRRPPELRIIQSLPTSSAPVSKAEEKSEEERLMVPGRMFSVFNFDSESKGNSESSEVELSFGLEHEEGSASSHKRPPLPPSHGR